MNPTTRIPETINGQARLIKMYSLNGKTCYGCYCNIRRKYIAGPDNFGPVEGWEYATKEQESAYHKQPIESGKQLELL